MALVDHANSDRQKEYAEAVDDCGSEHQAAKILGVSRDKLHSTLGPVKKRRDAAAREARQGYSPPQDLHRTPVEGFDLDGFSDMRTNEEGKPIWYKFNRDKTQQAQQLQAFIEGLASSIPPAKPKPIPKPRKFTPDLLTGIFIGDAHVGARAFSSETKHSDFNTDKACEQLRAAIDYLLDKAEPTETGLLVDVGDFTHANGNHNSTFKGTPVDIDTRNYRTMRASAEVMQYMIDRMLDKFKRVIVVVAKGNHNTDPAEAVQLMLEFYYSREKRVQVLPTEGFYHYLEYGKWLLGVHHGDKQKPEALASSMARDMPEAWGRTTHRMWCTGHFHKDALKTLPGVKHKIFGAMPPPDSWHASMGFMGDGEMEMMTFRKEGGLYSTHVYNIPQPRNEPDVKI